jgi:hypothetical protein
MKQQTVRAIARNLVIAATLGLAVVASWAVTGMRSAPVDLGQASFCAVDGTAGLLRHCELAALGG